MHWCRVTILASFFYYAWRGIYFFGIKMISTLRGLTYRNINKMANKIFNVPNHLTYCQKVFWPCEITDDCKPKHAAIMMRNHC